MEVVSALHEGFPNTAWREEQCWGTDKGSFIMGDSGLTKVSKTDLKAHRAVGEITLDP